MPTTTAATSKRTFDGANSDPPGVAVGRRQTPTTQLLSALFGGNKNDWNADGWAEQDVSMMSLPAGIGRNVPVISQAIEQKVIMADRYATQVLAPVRATNDTAITWDEFVFNAMMPTALPERGRTRIGRTSSDSHSDTLRRYGLGLEFNYGFFLQPEGLRHFRVGVEQINNAVLDAMAIGVFRAYLSATDWGTKSDIDRVLATFNQPTMEQVLERERLFFGLMQREQRPIQTLDLYVRNRQFAYKGEGDTWIIHWRTQEWVKSCVDAYMNYSIAGESGPQFVLDRTDAFMQFDGQRIYVVRTYDVDMRGEFDFMREIATYGEWVAAFDPHYQTDVSSYSSRWRAVQIYSADLNDWATIDLKQMIEGCGRWGDDGQLVDMNNLGESRMGGTGAGNADDVDSLSFGLNGRSRPIRFLGMMDLKHFGIDGIQRLAQTAIQSMGVTNVANWRSGAWGAAVNTLREAKRVMEEVPFDDMANRFLLAAIQQTVADNGTVARAQDSEHSNGVPSIKTNANRGISLPTTVPAAAGWNYVLPPMFGSPPGLRELAAKASTKAKATFDREHGVSHDSSVAIARALAIVDSVFYHLKTIFQDSAITQAKHASSYLVPHEADTFLENVLGVWRAPVFVRSAAPNVDFDAAGVRLGAADMATIVEKLAGVSGTSRDRLETTLTGKWMTGAAQTTSALRERFINADITAAAADGVALFLAQQGASLPAYARGTLRVVPAPAPAPAGAEAAAVAAAAAAAVAAGPLAGRKLDVAASSPNAIKLLAAIHNLAYLNGVLAAGAAAAAITDDDAKNILSTQLARAYVLITFASIQSTGSVQEVDDRIGAVVRFVETAGGIPLPTNARLIAPITLAQAQAYRAAVESSFAQLGPNLSLAQDRLDALFKQALRRYNEAVQALQEFKAAAGRPAQFQDVAGYLRSPLVYSPQQLASYASFVTGLGANPRQVPAIVPADPIHIERPISMNDAVRYAALIDSRSNAAIEQLPAALKPHDTKSFQVSAIYNNTLRAWGGGGDSNMDLDFENLYQTAVFESTAVIDSGVSNAHVDTTIPVFMAGMQGTKNRLGQTWTAIVNSINDPLLQIAALAYAMCPPTKQNHLTWVDKDVVFPHSFLGMRPVIRFATYMAIKVHIADYMGGMGLEPFIGGSKSNVSEGIKSNRKGSPSIFWILEPYSRQGNYGKLISAYGRFNPKAIGQGSFKDLADDKQSHFVNVTFARAWFGLSPEKQNAQTEEAKTYDQREMPENMTMWRGMALYWMPDVRTGGGSFTGKRDPLGYFGRDIYGVGMAETWSTPFRPYSKQEWAGYVNI